MPHGAAWFEGFEDRFCEVDGNRLFVRHGGRALAPPVLLLHGFPQTHAMWQRVAMRLAPDFRVVAPDLLGYGDSDKPTGQPDHARYSKRSLAADMVALMQQLGHERFFVAAHDRGARVAHRLALDHPQRVARLCLIDIAPTLDMYAATDMDFARAYYHWFFLIQPEPLPERLIGAAPRFYLHANLGSWGSQGLGHIEARALADYERCFELPGTVHAVCEDYRASAGIDLEHDRASRAAGQRIGCDLLVLWGERGVVHRSFDPLALWRPQCAADVSGQVLPAGHFIPEELPEATATLLAGFFTG